MVHSPGRPFSPEGGRERTPFPASPRASRCLVLVAALLVALPAAVRGQAIDIGRLAALAARSIGPAGMSGRITAIDASESDPNLIFVGAATGGVWRSVNGGQTWEPVFDDQEVLGIGSVAVFQANPEIVWVGTGEGNPRNSAGVGAGIYKSTDGGFTWALSGLERSERIHRVLLHPTDPDVAYAGVMGPAWSDGSERGVYRTRDGGTSWERVLFVDQSTGVGDLVMDPANPNVLLAGMWEFRRWPWFFRSGGPGSGLYRTEDGGDTWTEVTAEDGLPAGNLGRIGLAMARSRPDVVYALVEAGRSELLRSEDGGKSWRTVNDEEGVAPRPFYYGDIVVDPKDEMRLFDLHSRLMRSQDGGESFADITGRVHSDFHALWIAPSDPRLMYAGTDGGVYVSQDGGDHWRFVENLPVGQFYHVSVDSDIPYNVYGGMQDNGSWRGPSDVWESGGIRNYHWKEVGFGDGFGTLVDPLDPAFGYSMSQGGRLVRFDLRTGERKDIRPWGPEGVTLRFNWNAAIATDPLQPGVLYYGSQFVHRTTNRGESWEIISGDLTTDDPEKQRQAESGGLTPDNTGAENHTTLLTIAPSPVEPEVIWAGSDDGRVHLTRSGGGDWEEVGRRIPGVPEASWVAHIEASKHARGAAYVVFDDHRRGNWEPYVFRTEDYGRRWRNLANGGLRGFVHTLEEDPVSPNLLFAGTEFGLFVSLNRGEDWLPWRHGIPAVPVRSLAVHPRDHDLVIGTHGRGIYILDDIRPLRALAEDPSVMEAPVHLFSPPPAFLRSTAAADGYHFPGDALFSGTTRPAGALLTYHVGRAEAGREAFIEVLDPEGNVIRSLEGPAEMGLNRVTWDLRETNPLEDEDEGGRGGLAPRGPEVLPGLYGIRVNYGEAGSFDRVEVVPDPRVEIPLTDRILRRNAVKEGLALLRVLQAMEKGLVAVRGGVRELSSGGGLSQETRLAADSALAESERISGAAAEAGEYRRAILALGGSRDAPTEAERIILGRARVRVDGVVARFNAFVWGRLAELRKHLTAEGIEDLPPLWPIPRHYGDEGAGETNMGQTMGWTGGS